MAIPSEVDVEKNPVDVSARPWREHFAQSPWLPWLSGGYALGCGLPAWWHSGWLLGLAFGAWLLATPLLLLSTRRERNPLAQRLLACLLCLLAGMLAVGKSTDRSLPPQFIDRDATVLRVLYQGYGIGLLAKLEQADALHSQPTPVPKRLFVRANQGQTLRVADRVRIRGRIANEPSPWGGQRPVLVAARLNLIQRREDGARGFAWSAIDGLPQHRDLAATLLLGQGRPATRDAFHGAGLLHLLAVSGLHLGLALFLFAQLMRLLGLPWALRQGLLLAAAFGYAWLAGMSLPTQRAMIMTMAVVLYGLGGREPHRLGPLSLAVLALLVIDPQQARQIGFQLSALAVFGILTMGLSGTALRQRYVPLRIWPLDRPLWRGLMRCCQGGCDSVIIGLAATAAIVPITAGNFGEITPLSAIVSVLAGPALLLILAAGLPLIFLQGFIPNGPWTGLHTLVDLGLSTLVTIAQTAATHFPSLIKVPTPSFAFYLVWFLALLPWPRGVNLLTKHVWWWRIAFMLIAILLWWWGVEPTHNTQIRLAPPQ